MKRKISGYIYAILAAVTYGINPLFAIPLYGDKMDEESILFWSYLPSIAILLIILKRKKIKYIVTPKEYLPIFSLGILMSISSLAIFASYKYIDVCIASILNFIYPVIVALIMITLFKEKIKPLILVCLISTFYGVYLLYSSQNGTHISTKGVLFVLLSAITYALYLIIINSKNIQKVSSLTITTHVLTIGAFFFFLIQNFGKGITIPTKPISWLYILALSFICTTISFICTTKASQNAGPTTTAILGALEPVTGIFIGIIFFKEILTSKIIYGIVIILISVCIVISEDKIGQIKKIILKPQQIKKYFHQQNEL